MAPSHEQARRRRVREVRSKVLPVQKMTLRERVSLRVLHAADVADAKKVQRPTTRGDCIGGERPCPFVGCKHNLYLDVQESSGNIKLNFPDLDPEEVPPDQSCSLDIADLGGGTLEDVGRLANLTRERVRQIEISGLQALRRHPGRLREYSDAPDDVRPARDPNHQGSLFRVREDVVAEEPAVADEERPTRISFFAAGVKAGAQVCADVWRVYLRVSADRGFTPKVGSWGQLDPELASIVPSTEGDMSKEADLTERQRDVLRGYRELSQSFGRQPKLIEIANHIGLLGKNDHAREVSVATTLRALRERGLAEPTRKDRAPRAKIEAAEQTAIVVRKAVAAPSPSHPHPFGSSNLLDMLRTELASAERRVVGLRTALAALEETS